MKKVFFTLFMGVLLLQSVFAAETLIPDKNQVILTIGSKYLSHKVEWVPTKEETTKALNAIFKFLQNPEEHKNYSKVEINKINLIRERFLNYRVQFVGIAVDGKRRIHCNFFPNKESFSYWKESYVFVFDGGYSFWRIDFDINSGKCLKFESNGDA
jgi:hypothetical protein